MFALSALTSGILSAILLTSVAYQNETASKTKVERITRSVEQRLIWILGSSFAIIVICLTSSLLFLLPLSAAMRCVNSGRSQTVFVARLELLFGIVSASAIFRQSVVPIEQSSTHAVSDVCLRPGDWHAGFESYGMIYEKTIGR